MSLQLASYTVLSLAMSEDDSPGWAARACEEVASRPGRREKRPGEYCSLIALLAESALPEKPGNLDTFSILPLIC